MILASKSPRRKEILQRNGYDFKTIPSHSKEVFDFSLPLDEALEKVAYQKAKEVQKEHSEDIILSADTIVVMNGKILGKPKSDKQAHEFLRSYSHHHHQVKTGVCILTPKKEYSFVETTTVYFKKITDKDIASYMALNTYMDKAGAYGIQDPGFINYIDHIEGSFTNVVGLPEEKVNEILRKL